MKLLVASVRVGSVLAVVFSAARLAEARTIQFAGCPWTVKVGDGLGPGYNDWSDSTENVWLDGAGLHLKMTKRDGKWYSAEVTSVPFARYGVQRFYVSSRVDRLNENVVAAAFLYADDNREVDIEFARWGDPSAPWKAQYVIQPPSWAPGQYNDTNMHRFLFDLLGYRSTHYMNWQSASARFKSFHGHSLEPTNAAYLIQDKTLSGYANHVPQESDNLRVHINLWHLTGTPPSDGQPVEFIIKKADLSLLPATAAITSCPATVLPRAPITVAWTVTGGLPTSNRVMWGILPTSMGKKTPNDLVAPYQATFTAPSKPCTVYLRVQTIAHGQTSYSPQCSVVVGN